MNGSLGARLECLDRKRDLERYSYVIADLVDKITDDN